MTGTSVAYCCCGSAAAVALVTVASSVIGSMGTWSSSWRVVLAVAVGTWRASAATVLVV